MAAQSCSFAALEWLGMAWQLAAQFKQRDEPLVALLQAGLVACHPCVRVALACGTPPRSPVGWSGNSNKRVQASDHAQPAPDDRELPLEFTLLTPSCGAVWAIRVDLGSDRAVLGLVSAK